MTTKYKYGLIGIALILMLGNVVHAQTQTGYRVPARVDVGGGRMTGDMWCQYGTNGVRFIFGTQTVTQVGTSGVMTGTIANGSPSLDISYGGGSTSANFDGFNAVYVAGSQVGTSGALAGKLDAVDGVGTGNTFNNPTFAGLGTITASFGANGLVISPIEVGYLDGMSENINNKLATVSGSVTNHAHTGNDGTTQIAHDKVTGTGTNPHTTIDSFIASKSSASGLAALDANSLVVQNPASGTSTSGVNKTVMSDGTGKILDGWLSDNITKLGTPTTDNVSEGSTNKYYTDARVNAAVGSLTVNTLSDANIKMNNENDFVKIVGGQLVAGSSSVTVAFSEVTGSATSAQLPNILELPAITTAITGTSQNGRWYNLKNISIAAPDAYTELLLRMNNPGSASFTDSSSNAYTVTANSGAIGTTTAKFGSGGGAFNGTTDYLSIADNDNWYFTGDFTIDFWVRHTALSAQQSYIRQWNDPSGFWVFRVTPTNTLLFQTKNTSDATVALFETTSAALSSTGTWYHIALVRSGNTAYIFVDGVSQALTVTTAFSADLTNITAALNIAGQTNFLNGVMDEMRISNGIARWTANFTPPVQEYGDIYNHHSAQYIPPGTSTSVLSIVDDGTVTAKAYLIANVTTAIFGVGTNTDVTGTTTPYAGWFAGAVRATAFNVASTEKIKENIKTIKIKPDTLDAEALAKLNYIANSKIAWIAANGGNYTTIVTEVGTGSVIVVDTDKMESDYNNYIELEWASDINQDVYTENIQKTYEKGFWQMFDSVTPKSWNPKDKPTLTRKGFVVEEMPDVVLGDDRQSLDPMALIAYISLVQQTLKADTIFALRTLKELLTTGTVTQQNIDYCNDRLEVLNP